MAISPAKRRGFTIINKGFRGMFKSLNNYGWSDLWGDLRGFQHEKYGFTVGISWNSPRKSCILPGRLACFVTNTGGPDKNNGIDHDWPIWLNVCRNCHPVVSREMTMLGVNWWWIRSVHGFYRKVMEKSGLSWFTCSQNWRFEWIAMKMDRSNKKGQKKSIHHMRIAVEM